MLTVAEILGQLSASRGWDERVALLRTIPEHFGTADQPRIFSEIAKSLYVPHLTPDFAFVHWSPEYEQDSFDDAYADAYRLTHGFTRVVAGDIENSIREAPATLRIFRVILGLGPQELAASTGLVLRSGERALTATRVKAIEAGAKSRPEEAAVSARAVDALMSGALFGLSAPGVRSKLDKADTRDGWTSVQDLARSGVPYATFLHQRHYGGAFRQLLDATSTRRGDVLEDAVQALFESAGIGFVRTGAANQAEIERRFGLTVHPAPDFIVFDGRDVIRAILECKVANDGGTARDKAARFRNLQTEGRRLGGIPVVAVVSGLGWTRTNDALGPVVQATDGRTFTLGNLGEILTVEPFSSLTPS